MQTLVQRTRSSHQGQAEISLKVSELDWSLKFNTGLKDLSTDERTPFQKGDFKSKLSWFQFEWNPLDQFVRFKETHSRARCRNSVPHPINSASHRIIGIQYWSDLISPKELCNSAMYILISHISDNATFQQIWTLVLLHLVKIFFTSSPSDLYSAQDFQIDECNVGWL